MKKKHGLLWWLFIGWWWYIGVAWWLYPIVRLLTRKKKSASVSVSVGVIDGPDPRKLQEVMLAVLDAVQRSGGSALQVEVKASIPGWMTDYFEDAVHELYENGKIRMSKDGARVRLDLV